jgi:hypothetical protein
VSYRHRTDRIGLVRLRLWFYFKVILVASIGASLAYGLKEVFQEANRNQRAAQAAAAHHDQNRATCMDAGWPTVEYAAGRVFCTSPTGSVAIEKVRKDEVEK